MPSMSVNNIDMDYKLSGLADAAVRGMNNGVLMDAFTSWNHQRDGFAHHCRVLLSDCRGQGQSGHPPVDYSMQQVEDLADTLSEVQPDLHLVVASWRDAAHESNSESFYNPTIRWNISAGFFALDPELIAQTSKCNELLDFPAVTPLCDAFLQFDFFT